MAMDKCQADTAAEDFIFYSQCFPWLSTSANWGNRVRVRMTELWQHYPEAWRLLTVRYGVLG